MGGVNESARSLKPRLNLPRARKKVPAKNHRHNTHAVKSSAAGRQFAPDRLSLWSDACVGLLMWRRRVRLPQRLNVAAELKLPAQEPGVNYRCEYLAQLESSPEKLEVRAFAYAGSPIDKRPIFPASPVSDFPDGVNESLRSWPAGPSPLVGAFRGCCQIFCLSLSHHRCCHQDKKCHTSNSPQNPPTLRSRHPDLVFRSNPCFVPCSSRSCFYQKKTATWAAFPCPCSISLTQLRAQPARRPCQSWSEHSAHRPDLPVLRAAA